MLKDKIDNVLKTLTYRKTLDDTDLLATVYYLLLQDRIEEAEAAFGRVNPERVATRLQYDYCASYLAMFNEDAERARAIATRHLEEPVDRWRNAFAAVVAQLDEVQGRGPRIADAAARGPRAAGRLGPAADPGHPSRGPAGVRRRAG